MNSKYDDERYDGLFRTIGDPVPVAQENDIPMLMAVRSLLNSRWNQPLKHICFRFINDPEINAVAFSAEQTECIGLNVGAIVGVSNIISAMLRHPKTFREIGEPHLETDEGWKVDIEHRINTSGWPRGRVPRCVIRENYFQYAYVCAIDFILAHEIAHIEHCHLELRGARRLSETVIEIEDSAKRQAWGMEVDADRKAFFSTFQFTTEGPVNWIKDGKVVEKRQYTKEEVCRRMFTALSAVFWVFAGAAEINYRSASHPSPLMRSLHLQLLFSQQGYGFDQSDKALADTAEAMCYLGIGWPSVDPSLGRDWASNSVVNLTKWRNDLLPEIRRLRAAREQRISMS